jgi:hypothetical protein
MRNVIGPFKNHILCKYDLKGSSVNRKTDFEIDSVEKIVMKDLNFDEIEKYIMLSSLDKERLRFACTADAYFLNDMEIMDYSLFVVKLSLTNKEIESVFGKKASHEGRIKTAGINEDIEIGNTSLNFVDESFSFFKNPHEIHQYKKYMYRSLNENIVYIISIIDYLQIYNFYKYLETNFKVFIRSGQGKAEGISCVAPDFYCNRFIEYIKKITDMDEKNLIDSSDTGS